MNIQYDKVADAVYVQVSESDVASTVSLGDTLLVDKDSHGSIVGFEILDASSQENVIRSLESNIGAGVPITIVENTLKSL